jgi:hypothetical protein
VHYPDPPHDAYRGGQLADEPKEGVEAKASVESHLTAPISALPDRAYVPGLDELRPRAPVNVEQRAGPHDDVVPYEIAGQVRVIEPSQTGRDPLAH